MSAHAAPAERVRLKRVYEPPSPEDGVRVLIDRLWPRGVRKADAAVERWMKDIAPSAELRRWFGHDPERGQEFRRRYAGELRGRSLAPRSHCCSGLATKSTATPWSCARCF